MRIFLITTLLFLFSININAQSIADFDDATIYFNGIFGVTSTLDEYGNIYLDVSNSSGSDTQYKFRITDVNISMEEKTDDQPAIVIDFTCRKTECIYDPYDSPPIHMGSISIADIRRGKKAYNYLLNLQEFIKNN